MTAAQTSSQPQTRPQQPDYTFRAESRVVLTDVTVTDRQGKPVRGLPQSAFRISDNNQPQSISSFEEHVPTPAAAVQPAPTAAGSYSNDFLNHLPPVLNILLIDTTNLQLVDQMYLNYELTQLIKKLPPGVAFAVYLRAGENCVMLQNFTSDPTLLQTAVHKAIPRFLPYGRQYLRDQDTLKQLTTYLSQLPGRKNVLWFSGGSSLYLREDATAYEDYASWRQIYDDLEQERIAVYPIDARGLTVASGPLQWTQHMLMTDVARATGGAAVYNNNGLKEAVDQIVDSDTSFYTLTYSPRNFRFNNKWHKVKIELNGASYNLSYRTGYFADGSVGSAEQPQNPRTRLLIGGEKVEQPELRSVPILFNASVLPTLDPARASMPTPTIAVPPKPPRKGTTQFTVRYSVPLDALTVDRIHDSQDGALRSGSPPSGNPQSRGEGKVMFGVAVFAVNREGRMIEHTGERISISLNRAAVALHPDAPLSVDQQINLERGDEYLYLAVWDMASGRLGTLQIPLDVRKPSMPKDERAKN